MSTFGFRRSALLFGLLMSYALIALGSGNEQTNDIVGTFLSPVEWQGDFSVSLRLGSKKDFDAWVISDFGDPSNRPVKGTYVLEGSHLYLPLYCSLEEWGWKGGLPDPAIVARMESLTITNINGFVVLMSSDALQSWLKNDLFKCATLLIRTSTKESYRLKNLEHPSLDVLSAK